MRQSLIILIAILGYSMDVSAQMKTVIIQNNRAINDTLFNKRMFFLEDFADSRITMKDGSMYSAKANIMTIYQYLVIIENGDTIRTSREKDIAMLSGGGSLIYKIDGVYHQILETAGGVSLAIAKMINFEGEKLTGAYGGSIEAAAITKVTRVHSESTDDNSWEWRREGRAEMRYQYKESLFLISDNKRYMPTKKNFERLFSKRKADIARFISDNAIQLSKNDDVITLFNYLV